MARTYWTIATGNPVHERQLGWEKGQGWGVDLDFSVEWTNKGKGTATIQTTEKFDPGTARWATKQKAIIYRDRQSASGAPDTFSGGTTYFQGYFDDPARQATGSAQNIAYQLHSVWWLFERSYFKQYRNEFTGFNHSLNRVTSASVAAGGSGYSVGQELTIVGGSLTPGVDPAKVIVIAVNAGAAVLVSVSNAGGSYTALPASPASTTVVGNGSGCTLSLVSGFTPNTVAKVCPEVYLGEGLDARGFEYHWTNGAQIGEVMDWVNATYNPTRHPSYPGYPASIDATQDVLVKGLIDPNTYAPITRVNSIFCSEAILNVLRWDPDAVIYEDVDPATKLPRLNVRKMAKWNNSTVPPTFIDYANLPEVGVPITSQQAAEVQAQDTRATQVPGVIITYKSVNQFDSVVVPVLVVDKYPPGVDDWTPEVVSQMVELGGAKVTHVVATVLTTPIAQAVSVNASDRAAWWQARDRSINPAHDPNVQNVVADVATVVDDNGNPVNLALYQYELLSNIPTWVGSAPVIRARVSATLSFNRLQNATSVNQVTHEKRVHTQTVKLTTTAGGSFSAVSQFVSGEVPPQNVAQSVYRSLANVDQNGLPMQGWRGRITLLDAPLRSNITIGTRLRLDGPNTTFRNCLVQSIMTVPARGQTTVEFSPGPAIDLSLWLELARASRARITYDMPSYRGDGGSSGTTGSVDTGGNGPSDNTSHGTGGASQWFATHAF